MVARKFNFSSPYTEMKPGVEEVDQAERDLERLHAELDALKKTLAERESALAQAALDAQEARDRWQQELAARIAAAERREKSLSALAELTAKCEAAEQTSEQLGQTVDAGASPQYDQAPSETTAPLEDTPRKSAIIIRTNRIWANEVVEEKRRESKKHATGGLVAAAALGFLVVMALITGGGSSPDLAVALRDVNVRTGPSTEAKIVSMLPRGVKVAMIEERGGWTLIRTEGAGSDTRPQQGWVNGSFLKKD